MAKLHEFARPMDLVTEFDGSEDVVPRQKPKYTRQLTMVDAESCMPDPTLIENKTKEDWPDSYDITVTISATSRLYEKYKWNEERIQRLEALIARFVKMSAGHTNEDVTGRYSLDADQLELFDSLKKRFLGEFAT